jgi:hypothetical protein
MDHKKNDDNPNEEITEHEGDIVGIELIEDTENIKVIVD